MLVWAVQGLQRYWENGKLTQSQSSDEIKSMWLRNSNSFSAFIMDCLELDFGVHISKPDMRLEYNKYCMKHKVTPVGDKIILECLSRELGVVDQQITISDEDEGNLNKTRERVWMGVKFKENQRCLNV